MENRKVVGLVPELYMRWFSILLNTKSPKLDPSITEDHDEKAEDMPLEPTMKELTGTIRYLLTERLLDRIDFPSSSSRSSSMAL